MKFIKSFSSLCFFIKSFEWNYFKYIIKTPLKIAAEKGNPEIVGLLLLHPQIDINIKSIFIFFIINKIL